MEQLNGIVMELSGRHVILMTTKGEFKRVRIMGRLPELGEELSIPVAHRRFFSAAKASWMGVAAAVILVLTASPLINIINSPPDKAGPPGMAATGQETTEKAAIQVDSAVINVADKQPELKVTIPAAEEKLTNPKVQETVIIAKDDLTPPAATTSDTTAVLPKEIQSAAKPEPGLTGLTTDRNYINPVNGTDSSGVQSGTTDSQADISQTIADEDTKNNYMGDEVPGDRETGSGLDSHLQKPNF